MHNFIKIKGARVHNLKNINVEIPRNRLVVLTGVSGSGKSSLAFDTLYAESQRLYIESLSSYARQFIGIMNKPDVDLIEGLSPAISIDQKSTLRNPRSTVGTITEIYDYLRLLFARIGKYSNYNSNVNLPKLEPRNFSFNSPYGACPDCLGIGSKLEINPELIINPNLTIAQGAIKPLARNIIKQNEITHELNSIASINNFNINTLIKNLTKKQLNIIFYGSNNENIPNPLYQGGKTEFEGIIPILELLYKQTKSDYIKKEIEQYMRTLTCPTCQGKRLKPEALEIKIAGLSIFDITNKTIEDEKKFFYELINNKLISERDKKIIAQILKEILARLDSLINIGLNYLTSNRSANTLSGGEAQRIKLATQINSTLTGVLYILDEPSVGLHQRDNNKLIDTLKKLRDLGNTIIVVEHDKSTMLASDWIIDFGPGAGEHGGNIIAKGTPEQIKKSAKSLTGQYLSNKKSIQIPTKYRIGNGKKLKIIKASEHNLKNINVEFPLGSFIAITGVSGSGKSTLITDILANSLNQKFYRAKQTPGKHEKIVGTEYIDKIINIDQSPIGRTPRSNPATYTGTFTIIRDLFANLPEAKIKNYKTGHFSFNITGGRCETCNGDGLIKIDMQFLSDIYIECDGCHGKRYNKEILEIYYKDQHQNEEKKNISDILNLTIEEALIFFKNISAIKQKLTTLNEVGLGYMKLGQPATTLSGGEAQRIKLATELSRRATGKTLYILDEPTTGLHFEDIKKLLLVLNKLVDKGNTVLIIEHNLDVIKSVDWIIDLGPEGGDKGGKIITTGTPQEVAKNKKSYTGQYLAKILK